MMRSRQKPAKDAMTSRIDDLKKAVQPRKSGDFNIVFMPILGFISAVMILNLYNWIILFNGSQPTYIQQESGAVLVSYSYYENSQIHRENLEYFIAAGTFDPPKGYHVHYSFVVNGDQCTPCSFLYRSLRSKEEKLPESIGIKSVWGNHKFTLIRRSVDEGGNTAAHNITIEYFKFKHQFSRYKYFIFLSSTAMGPFYPKIMPHNWHWTEAFTSKITKTAKAVSSSLVCLPEMDAGGPGARLESWAFGTDMTGLNIIIKSGTLNIRECTQCAEGVVVMGEYGMSIALLREGYQIRTFMSIYDDNTDWTDPVHWHCNNNAHPSRHGSYANISQHPYETMFVQSAWHVNDLYTRRYARWRLQQIGGIDTTQGKYVEPYYRYAIMPDAQEDHNIEECYKPQYLKGN